MAAIETIYRLLGGDAADVTLRTPETEQREVDRHVVARLLWDLWQGMHHMPERIAIQVWKHCPWVKQT